MLPCVSAGGLTRPWLHCPGEAVSRVRSHISPGPYRSFRELSLARSVDLATWCPPTFVGNSGIECSNGHRGFALTFSSYELLPPVLPAQSSYSAKRSIEYVAASRSIATAADYWITRFRG